MEITINVSKPKKTVKEIEAARKAPAGDYPRCLLCAENEGYSGRLNQPPRQNLRLIPLTLAGEPWYFQYSPYLYYNEHKSKDCRGYRILKRGCPARAASSLSL